jgi:uncharacterized protein YjbI with pentapeptide repeats
MNPSEAISLLRRGESGIDEWNCWRKSRRPIPNHTEADRTGVNVIHPGILGVNHVVSTLFGADLSETSLIEADLSGADLGGADLSGADLNQANLSGTNLYKADLIAAKLNGANLTGAKLRWADLGGADLTGASLNQASLDQANLTGASLNQANLTGAKLRWADLTKATLNQADLTHADLTHADLNQATLNQADLTHADLTAANLNHADLSGANLKGAMCSLTWLSDLDLSQVRGLEDVQHKGPSSIGVDTLIKSQGKIPAEFLRGCGVPDVWITNIPALIGSMQPIQFYSCFISYSTKDEDFAQRLHSRMVQEKLRVWFAPEDMQGGKKVHEQIDQAIRLYDKLLLILSPNSLGSEWVMTEIRKARKQERQEGKRKLFPIRLVGFETLRDWECFDADAGKDLAVEVREYFIPDFSMWKDHDTFESGFARLLADLKKGS